jgi:Tfp pilus assembly protein PilF
MKKRITLLVTGILGLSLFLVGCGKATQPKSTTSSTTPSTTMTKTIDDSQYSGTQNLNKLESFAKASPNDAIAQLNAGISAYSNKDYTKAIDYYNNAIKANPKYGMAYNNIGNVYFRGLNKPDEALQYYKKATQVDPTYNYGWLNLALCQQKLGDKEGAKVTIDQGLKVLSANDTVAVALKKMQVEIK